MKEFWLMNWPSIVAAVVIVAGLLTLWFLRKVPFVKKTLYAMVCEVEKKYGSGTGDIKYATVVAMFYYRMPTLVRILFTQQLISTWIEDAVKLLKKELSEGMTLTGYDEEAVICNQQKTISRK